VAQQPHAVELTTDGHDQIHASSVVVEIPGLTIAANRNYVLAFVIGSLALVVARLAYCGRQLKLGRPDDNCLEGFALKCKRA
jgi:hypothetical protein